MNAKVKRAIIIAVAVALLLFAVVGVVVLARVLAGSGEDDPYGEVATQSAPEDSLPAAASDEASVSEQTDSDVTAESNDATDADESSSLDPESVATVAIEPLGIEVAYVRGVGGFTYEVLGTVNGTQTVEFRNEELKGTKCTDDKGTFVAITADPTDAERQTFSKERTVDGTVYGLSLSSPTCTGNTELLSEYQASFSDAFSLLKKL